MCFKLTTCCCFFAHAVNLLSISYEKQISSSYRASAIVSSGLVSSTAYLQKKGDIFRELIIETDSICTFHTYFKYCCMLGQKVKLVFMLREVFFFCRKLRQSFPTTQDWLHPYVSKNREIVQIIILYIPQIYKCMWFTTIMYIS